jgi:hypothetical protein
MNRSDSNYSRIDGMSIYIKGSSLKMDNISISGGDNLTIKTTGKIESVNGNISSGGDMLLQSSQLKIDSSRIATGNQSSLTIKTINDIESNNSMISSGNMFIKAKSLNNNSSFYDGGNFTIHATDGITNNGYIEAGSDLFIKGNSLTTNYGGIHAQNITIKTNEAIKSNFLDLDSRGGDIFIKADSLKMNNPRINSGNLNIITKNGFNINGKKAIINSYGDVFISSSSFNINGAYINSHTTGVNTGSLIIRNGGRISSVADFDPGNIIINANNLTIDRQGSNYLTGISSAAFELKGMNDAGDIKVTVKDTLSLLGGGVISSTTLSDTGNAGKVNVTASNILIDGLGGGTDAIPTIVYNVKTQKYETKDILLPRPISPGISSDNFFSTGHAGTVDVTANTLTMTNGGVISSDTLAFGKAGDVSVNASFITLDNARISAEATDQSQGQTGNVTVTANNAIYLSNDSKISIQNDANSDNLQAITPTSLTVTAPEIALKNSSITTESTGNINASNININFSKLLKLDPSFITTSANTGNGGSITINGTGLIYLENSGFLTSVKGENSNGGDINVTANTLVMNNGVIQANAVGGSGGDINLNLQSLIPSYNQLIKGGALVVWQPFIAGFNVIQAASENGVSGSVNVSSPQFNISGSISGLSSVALVIPQIDHRGCQGAMPSSSTHGNSLLEAVLKSKLAQTTVNGLVRGSTGGIPITEAQYSFIPPANNLSVENQKFSKSFSSSQPLKVYTSNKKNNSSCDFAYFD